MSLVEVTEKSAVGCPQCLATQSQKGQRPLEDVPVCLLPCCFYTEPRSGPRNSAPHLKLQRKTEGCRWDGGQSPDCKMDSSQGTKNRFKHSILLPSILLIGSCSCLRPGRSSKRYSNNHQWEASAARWRGDRRHRCLGPVQSRQAHQVLLLLDFLSRLLEQSWTCPLHAWAGQLWVPHNLAVSSLLASGCLDQVNFSHMTPTVCFCVLLLPQFSHPLLQV